MVRKTLCCCVVVAFVSCVTASAQRTTQRRPAPAAPPARDAAPSAKSRASGPIDNAKALRPPGSKPILLKTAQNETARLKEAIEKREQQIAQLQTRKEDGAKAPDAGDEPAAADAGEAPDAKADGAAKTAAVKTDKGAGAKLAPAARATLASVERENGVLRRQLDKLLLKVGELDGQMPEKVPGLPPFDPHVLDRPNNSEFCPGKTLDELEHSMLYSGRPIAETDDGEVYYEWVFHMTNKARSKHSTHHVWAVIKDGVASQVMEGAPGVVTDGPPPKTF